MNIFFHKKGIRGVISHVAVAVLLALMALPAISSAQTAGTSSINWFYGDGSNESTSTRRERIRGYRQQSSELQQKISALGSTTTAAVFMPVLFGVGVKDIFPNFGDPRDGGRTHEGEDIMAVKGTPIVSPTAAVVMRVGTGSSEGNYVYTANPGGETFVYMHLDRFAEGIASGLVLKQGSLIGYVGNTGNAAGGPAHLHFEIHDASNTPVDPFPRLSAELSLQEKITDLSTILTQTTDATALSQFLVVNFRDTFTTAFNANILLPLPIISALAAIPAPTSPRTTPGPLPADDLDLGSSGSAVVVLQRYLIQAASGPAATRLAGAGATGNFGAITQAALMEFQVKAGIAPANGYYGLVTRAYVVVHPLGTLPGAPVTPTAPGTLTRDLYQGVSGEDVRSLQKILNAKGYAVAVRGAGSVGNETINFGPATKAAVIRFQVARGIVPAAGYVGPLTRAALAL